MDGDFAPPFELEAQRRYSEYLNNMQSMTDTLRRILDMTPEQQKAWISGLSDEERLFLIVSVATFVIVPHPTYSDFLCDELNRRHGLYGTPYNTGTP